MAVLTWPHNRVEQLKKLWEAGLSASQIAAELGNVSRNAIIGKVHRLGLSGRAKSLSSAAPPHRKAHPAQHMMRVTRPIARGNTALAQAFEVEPDPVTSDNVVPMSQRLSLLELNEATCHWPIGDPSKPGFLLLWRQGPRRLALLREARARRLSAARQSKTADQLSRRVVESWRDLKL
jgi:GcrA cell cycle regulator